MLADLTNSLCKLNNKKIPERAGVPGLDRLKKLFNSQIIFLC